MVELKSRSSISVMPPMVLRGSNGRSAVGIPKQGGRHYRSRSAASSRAVLVPHPFRGGNRPGSNHRGAALLVVILVVLTVTILASQLVMQIRTELRVAANGKELAISRYLAESGVQLALFHLLDNPAPGEGGQEETDFPPGQTRHEFLPTGKVTFSVVNESGKINLHAAPRELLELFFLHHGLESEEIGIVIDSLLDWQDTDDLHRLQGAESEYYRNLEEPYQPRNGPVQDPAEFFLVRGTELLKGRFAPEDVFTVHHPGIRINFASLTPAMLDFLVAGDQSRKEAYREAQMLQAVLDEDDAAAILGEERFELLREFLAYESGPLNPHYTIEAVGLAGSQAEAGEPGPERPGLKIKTRVRVIGSVIHYLSWTEERV